MGSFTPGVSVSESYYALLSVEPHATPDEIRKAYRKLALRFHPDKNPDAGETFQKISTAYATLSDPQRRQVYDRFGEQGVQIMEQAAAYGVPPWLLNPAAQSGLLCVLLVVVVGLVVVFPVILTMRIDGGLAWPWPAVFTPLWLVDLLVLALAAASPRDRDAGCWRCVPNRRQVNLALLLAFQLLLAYKLDAGEQARSDHPRPPTALPHTHTHTLAPATRPRLGLGCCCPCRRPSPTPRRSSRSRSQSSSAWSRSSACTDGLHSDEAEALAARVQQPHAARAHETSRARV